MDTILTQISVDPDWEFLLLLEKGEHVQVMEKWFQMELDSLKSGTGSLNVSHEKGLLG